MSDWLFWLLILVGLLVAWSVFLEPNYLALHRFTKNIPDMEGEWRVLFLSDIHLGLALPQPIWRLKLWQLKKRLRSPIDLIVLGGDYIDTNAKYLPDLKRFLQALQSFDVPILAVWGNHDYDYVKVDATKLAALFQSLGIKLLENEVVTLTQSNASLHVFGMADLRKDQGYWMGGRVTNEVDLYRQAAAKIPWYQDLVQQQPEGFRLVVGHNPDTVWLPGQPRPHLVLSGHTHGGQVFFLYLLTWLLRPTLPPGSFQTKAGCFTLNDTTVLVSRGFGGALTPIRLLASAQAHLITLKGE